MAKPLLRSRYRFVLSLFSMPMSHYLKTFLSTKPKKIQLGFLFSVRRFFGGKCARLCSAFRVALKWSVRSVSVTTRATKPPTDNMGVVVSIFL